MLCVVMNHGSDFLICPRKKGQWGLACWCQEVRFCFPELSHTFPMQMKCWTIEVCPFRLLYFLKILIMTKYNLYCGLMTEFITQKKVRYTIFFYYSVHTCFSVKARYHVIICHNSHVKNSSIHTVLITKQCLNRLSLQKTHETLATDAIFLKRNKEHKLNQQILSREKCMLH